MKKKIDKEKIKIAFLQVLKYIIYIAIVVSLLLGIFKIINWKKVFERDYESNTIVQRKIDLPPIVKNQEILEKIKKQEEIVISTSTMASTSTVSTSTKIVIRELSYAEKEWLEKFIKRLKSQNITIRQMEIGEYYDVFLISENKTRFKVSTKMNVDKAWNNTISVLANEKFKMDTNMTSGSAFDKLEYIDVRFENKIFYKLYGIKQNENLLASSTRQSL